MSSPSTPFSPPHCGARSHAFEIFINQSTADSLFPLFDPVEGRLLELKMVKMHDGIAKNGDFYTKCVDFTDQYGRTIDVDFLVWPRAPRPGYRVTQALVHKVDGEERPYRLDPRRWLPLMKKQ